MSEIAKRWIDGERTGSGTVFGVGQPRYRSGAAHPAVPGLTLSITDGGPARAETAPEHS